MIDSELIEKKVDMIEEGLIYLRQARETKRDDLLASFEKLQAVKHTLQETVEACLDIANHMSAAKGLPRSETYSGMFLALGKGGLLPKDLAHNLAEMARFRNLLVHRYGDVNSTKVYEILQESLTDVERFLREVERILGEESQP